MVHHKSISAVILPYTDFTDTTCIQKETEKKLAVPIWFEGSQSCMA